MTPYPPLALDAVVKAVSRLDPENDTARDLIAYALRISAATVAPPEPPPPPPPDPVPLPDTPVKPIKPEDVTPAPRRGPRHTRLYPLPRRVAPMMPSWTASVTAYQPPVPRPVAPPDPLFPRRTARGVLKAMLATLNPDERVDIAKALETLACAVPIAAWPRRLSLNMARGAALLVDSGPGLEPFRADLRALIDDVRTVVGIDRLQVHEFAGWPPAVLPFGAIGGGADDDAMQLPVTGAPVLATACLSRHPRPGCASPRRSAARAASRLASCPFHRTNGMRVLPRRSRSSIGSAKPPRARPGVRGNRHVCRCAAHRRMSCWVNPAAILKRWHSHCRRRRA